MTTALDRGYVSDGWIARSDYTNCVKRMGAEAECGGCKHRDK